MLFPRAEVEPSRTGIALTEVEDALPVVSWLGVVSASSTTEDRDAIEADGFVPVTHGPGMPLLGEWTVIGLTLGIAVLGIVVAYAWPPRSAPRI